MTRSLLRWTVTGLVLLAYSPGIGAADKLELRWHLKKGDVHKYLFKHDEIRTANLGDQEFKTTTDSEYDWQGTVKDVEENGVATLEMKLTGLRVKIEGKGYDLKYDSAGANEAPSDYGKKLVNLFNQLRLGSYTMKLKPDGTIAELKGLNKLLGEVGNDMNILDFNGWNLHDDTAAWYLQQALGRLPEKAAVEGSKWETKTETKLAEMGEVNGKDTFSLGKTVEVGDKSCREIKHTGSHTIELDMRWLNNSLKGTLKGPKVTGAVCFDSKAGKVLKSEVKAEFRGDLKFGDNAELKVELKHNLKLEAK